MPEIAKQHDVASPYAGYDVLAKWNTPSFDDVTRDALTRRLNETPPRRFLSPKELSLLEAVVVRVAPPLPGLSPSLIALWIDDRLSRNLGEGFRGEEALPWSQMWRYGLAAIDGEARRLFSASFVELDGGGRDATLRVVQAGNVNPELWRRVGAESFFTDTLLKTVAGLAYAHPSAWNDIGFGGPASPRGYVRLGFGTRDPWEAKELR
ncbi:gluconate 2-dehydrogenase subunit 3 family protein [Methylocystis sp. Sn-Cys]|uniref:gluconate 2-dehydrogenase subunit 3 family protein n=1 Tax=Methylocystis sp. Sn-Cys TaxID=1701263 RepID=UPI001924B3FC|nr:gluconate 2-dehydrogenase subunit 3 family protein [Methylocystis sp. Sn-Cys]MBL1258850.1 gluconate 2-dehydrogenase subunit 3 family protein [Methylocystis sp. Sn-Cys]